MERDVQICSWRRVQGELFDVSHDADDIEPRRTPGLDDLNGLPYCGLAGPVACGESSADDGDRLTILAIAIVECATLQHVDAGGVEVVVGCDPEVSLRHLIGGRCGPVRNRDVRRREETAQGQQRNCARGVDARNRRQAVADRLEEANQCLAATVDPRR